jgi:hypothetical protein
MTTRDKKIIQVFTFLLKTFTLLLFFVNLHEFLHTKEPISKHGLFCLLFIVSSVLFFIYLNKEDSDSKKNPE